MEAVVVDAGSKFLKAGYAVPDQEPSIIIPTKMRCIPEDAEPTDKSVSDDITVDPVIRVFIKDWDAMEDLLRYVLYTDLEWEVGNEGQVLFTDPLATPKKIITRLWGSSCTGPSWPRWSSPRINMLPKENATSQDHRSSTKNAFRALLCLRLTVKPWDP